MRDPKEAAIELLEARGQRDAARVLERCKITMRQLERQPERLGKAGPLAEVLIHAPKELEACVHGSSMPESSWSGHIEQALRDAAERDDFGFLVIQWVGTGPERPELNRPPKRAGSVPGRRAGRSLNGEE
jgi:hypothetical protein